MPKWINGKERLPTLSGKYFVRANGSKDIYSFYEFDADKINRYDTFLWLDESDEKKGNDTLLEKIQRLIKGNPFF